MNSDEYLNDRLNDQIDWYDRKSIANQRWYKRLRLSEFVLAALIPFLAGFAATHVNVQVTLGVIGVAITIITASLGLYQFEQNWIAYRTTCESLRKEKFLFLTNTEPYSGPEEDNLQKLVQRDGTLVSKENTNWGQYTMKPGDDKTKT